jgi:AraC family transcriptional regulator
MVLVNPPARLLGSVNAVVGGRGVRGYGQRFGGALSVKSVISGAATWTTGAGRFELVPGSVLILEDGEEYEITIEALQPVETFCLFFRRGFVEDAWRAEGTGSAELLDRPPETAVAFPEKLHFGAPLGRALQGACARMRRGDELEESFYATALALVRAHREYSSRVARVPALRASTREELARRLDSATSLLHASLDRSVTIEEAARAACLSPFHFHRLFTAMHGTTPHRYLRRLRLERARAMLRAGWPVAEVLVACGFASAGSFAALFRRTFGVTPGAIRKNEEADSGQAR